MFRRNLERLIDHAISEDNRRTPKDDDDSNFEYEIRIALCQCGPDSLGQQAGLNMELKIEPGDANDYNNIRTSKTHYYTGPDTIANVLRSIANKIENQTNYHREKQK